MSNEKVAKLASSFVVMVCAGADKDDIVELARAHNIRPVHFHQLAVPAEQDAARRLLITLLT